ncbi:MAG: hypothetical protein ACO1QB_15325 [Verrucomicrobiales bacterium]
MNRTLLLIICDFLLLSLLAFGKFDDASDPTATDAVNPSQPASAATTLVTSNLNQSVSQDLVQVLRSSLEEEQRSREELTATLGQTEQNLRRQQEMLAEREARISAAQRSLQEKEAEARALEQARASLESKFSDTQSNLQQIQQQLASTSTQAKMSQERLAQIQAEYQAAQTNLLGMQKELTSTSVEARAAKERLTALEQEVQARSQEAEQARRRAEEVAEARRVAEVEKERIAGQLKVAETEQKLTKEQLQAAQQNIQVVQQEKAQIQQVAKELAQGVVQFAEGQKEVAAAQQSLTQEIRENRPLSANTIFNDFITNRVNTDFRANRTGVLGRNVSRERQAKTILVSDGMQIYAIYHINDTPLKFEDFGTDWDRLVMHLLRGQGLVQPSQISFLSLDPRIVVAPVSEAQAKQLGSKVYRAVTDPYKFQEALLIGASEGYYGEAKFQIDAQLPNYIRMDRSSLGRLFGKFTPSRGDLVFSKSGQILGVMVNDTYAALLTSFVPTTTIPLGTAISLQQTGITLSQMQAYLSQLPERLR